MKKALICGVSGQDGAYLAQLLLNKGYIVCGTSRDAQMSSFQNLMRLGIREQVKLESVTLTDFRSVLQVLTKIQPDEVYNLAGQSSVGLSFEQPVETLESIATGTLNLLEAIRFIGAPIKLYNAGSSECFVEAMYLMLQQDEPDDYAIATGESHKLEDFVAAAFACVGLDWRERVVIDTSLLRPTDIAVGRGNPSKASQQLGWQAQYKMNDVVRMMVEARSLAFSGFHCAPEILSLRSNLLDSTAPEPIEQSYSARVKV